MEWKPVYRGKVRELYNLSDKRLIIVTTDRISAFDSILPVPVKGKGVILNQLSNFWFRMTRGIVPNHILDECVKHMPSFFQTDDFKGRTVMVKKLNMLPFEFIVRGYLFGSMWEACQNGKDFCGIRLHGSYQLAQKLEQPILTPAVKHSTGHDEYVSRKDVVSRLGAGTARQIEEICLTLYETCSRYALSKGLIIADAKFEFGQTDSGELTLGDELFTPDSSRYWDAERYVPGQMPDSFDKQHLRNWLSEHKCGGAYPFDRVPESILLQTAERYKACFNRLTK